ncbi:putative reverse transcriptase domain-containing protein [Tanacetum coccineum]
MDWLSKHKAEIVCHAKVVRIPLHKGKVLRVIKERPKEKVRHLMSAKAKEQKQEEIVVGEEHKLAFQYLKDKLCNASVLALPDGPKDFVVYCDASGLGLRYVLMRRGKVIAYASRQLKIHEKNYTAHDLELGAVKELNMRQHHCIELFSDYDWEIRYHPSKANVVVDTLIRKERVKPKRIRAMKMTLQSSIQDRIWVPLKGGVRTLIMDEAYKSKYFVHPGADKIYYDLRDMYLWLRMKKDIAVYVSKCFTCLKVLAFNARGTRNPVRHEYGLPPLDRKSDVRCAPFEALYGRKCRSLILWAEVGEGQLIGPELVQETTEKILQIKDKLKAARDRQKSYKDKMRKHLEFSVGDYVLLKVSLWKGEVHFGKKGKLAPRFVGPFKITERIGPVAYRLRLPKELNG